MYWQLFIHIGPVQDFIMSARRCRDLWFGSQLLSELAKAAATAIQAEIAGTEDPLIFPNAQSLETGSVANKIVVRVPEGDANRCREIANAGRTAMKETLERIAEEVFTLIEDTERSENFDGKLAREQIGTCMEYMWVAVPEEGNDDQDYVNARQRGEELLAARKNTRNWAQPSPASFGIPKSSLDGVRESVIHEDVYDKRKKDRYVPQSRRHRVYGVKGEERLCGIGLVKRKGSISSAAPGDNANNDIPVFHSAAHIASAGVRRRLAKELTSSNKETVQQAYANWLQTLQSALGSKGAKDIRIRADQELTEWELENVATPFALPPQEDGKARTYGYDGVALYPQRIKELLETYQDETLEADSKGADDRRQDLEDALRKLLRSIGAKDEPYPYYALLAADGDKMGAAIQQIKSADTHRKFSQDLDENFAQEAKGIIQRHGGTLIFAGGDDVLAMLPTCTALEAARELRDVFKNAMGDYSYTENGDTKSPTLSVGLALGHFMTPFAEVRALGKQAEQLAKTSGRNRLAILWDKRSGATRSVVGEWKDASTEEIDTLDLDLIDQRILAMAAWLESAGIPRSFAHRLLEVLDVAGPPSVSRTQQVEKAVNESENAMFLSLARRVIERRPIDDAYKKQFKLFLDHAHKTSKNATEAIQTLAHELLLANEFRLARKEAGYDLSALATDPTKTEAAE